MKILNFKTMLFTSLALASTAFWVAGGHKAFAWDCEKNPCGLQCSEQSGRVVLTWQAAESDIFRNPDGYRVFRSSSSTGPETMIKVVPIDNGSVALQTVSTTDTPPSSGTWCYRIQAFRTSPPADSDFTNQCCVKFTK